MPMPIQDPDVERPKTAKSPAHHFGADVDDALAQKMSMLSTPGEGQYEIYGKFGRGAEGEAERGAKRRAYNAITSGENHTRTPISVKSSPPPPP